MAADSLPKYMHPHSVARIIDNAVLTVSSSGLSNIFVAMEAEKGMPNEATYITTQSEWIFNFGEPNYAKYGQAQLNAINAINSGYGAWVIRVVPDDETFASLSLGIGYRPDQAYTNDEDEFKRLELTKTQIQLWNAKATSPAEKVAIFKNSGNTFTSVLGYIAETEAGTTDTTIRTDLGLVTRDYFDKYELENGSSNIAYEFVQSKYKNTYSNPYIKFTLQVSDSLDPTKWVGYGDSAYWKYTSSSGEYGDDPTDADRVVTFLAKRVKTVTVEENDIPVPSLVEVTIYAAAVEAGVGSNFADAVANVAFAIGAAQTGKTAASLSADLVASNDGLGDYFIGDGDKAINGTTPHTNDWLTVYSGKNAALSFSKVKLSDYILNVTSDFKFYIGAADKDEISGRPAGWTDSYEVYKKNVDGFYVPVVADDLNGEYAMTTLELDEFNDLFVSMDADDPKRYKLGSEVEGQAGVITQASTGQYLTESLFYVNYVSNGEPVYDTHTTESEVYNYNTLRAKDSDKTAVFVPANYNPELESQRYVYVPVTKTTMTYNSSVSSTGYWEPVNAEEADAAISIINNFSAIAEETKNFLDVDASADSSASGDSILNASVVHNKEASYAGSVKETDLSVAQYNGLIDEFKEYFEAVTDTVESETVTVGYDIKSAYLVGIKKVPVNKTIRMAIDGAIVNENGDELKLSISKKPSVSLVMSINSGVAEGSAAVTFFADKAVNDALKVFDEAEADNTTGFKIVAVKGEKAQYPCGNVDFASSKLAPNINYIERIYDTVGLATTTYTTYKMHEKTYAPYKQSETDLTVRVKNNADGIWNEIDEYKEGYRVGSDFSVIPNIDIQDTKSESNCFAEFVRFTPKGSGKWYNRIAVSLSYNNNYDGTYPDWSMFTLTIAERVDGVDTAREQFTVSFDPDAISGSKESLFIEDVVRRYSSYVNCTVNYDNLRNFIETKFAILDDKKKPLVDEDGNEIIVPVDTVIKYIFGIIDLDEFKERVFGEDYEHDEELLKASAKFDALMSVLGADEDGCKFDAGRFQTAEGGLQIQEYTEPFNSFMLFNTVSSSASLYLNGGSSGNGWEYEYDDEEGNKAFTSSLAQALVRAYSGVTDPFITNTNLCEFDLMYDANYDETVRKAMVELASVTRQDCMALLDQGLSIANATQAIDYRKNTENYDTFYAAIFTQHLTVNDGWSGKPIKVTPTYFLSSKIPANDIANGKTCNFVGPRRGTISGFTNISFMPTAYEMSELYKAQVNYIERDALGVYFATELTSQTKNTPLTLIHAVRGLLSLKRDFLKISRNYRSEYASTAVQAQLLGELNTCAAEYILQGAFKYITPVISSTEYDIQQRICRIDVSVAFVDIMERFVFSFIVER